MDELRHEHLGAPSRTPPGAPSVRQQLRAAYEAVVERNADELRHIKT
jgi:hypothetical protein